MAKLRTVCALWLLLGLPAVGQDTTGPDKGILFIVGGGLGKDDQIFRAFIKAAGGPDAHIVIVTTAQSSRPDHDYARSAEARFARKTMGMKQVSILHTHDRTRADSAVFTKPIEEADAVWFTGGRQWRLVDAYGGTRTEQAFHRLLERGGVIGGSSAGATIQGSFLVRGDTGGNRLMIGDHQHGFGFLKNAAIDQHVIARKRQFDMFDVLDDPEGRMDPKIDRAALLGIGVADHTALVVRGHQCEVIGNKEGVVLMYNPRTWTKDMPAKERFIRLPVGSTYDLQQRKVIHEKPDSNPQP
ncbi:MAG: cyanophycinase [Verrucomicrobiota bacterium]